MLANDDVVSLLGVVAKVVECMPLPVPVDHHGILLLTHHVLLRMEGLDHRVVRRAVGEPGEHGHEGVALDVCGRVGNLEEVAEGGQQVDGLRQAADAPAREEPAREAHDEGDAAHFVVYGICVPDVTMLAERLAVVRCDDDEGLLEDACAVEQTEDLTDSPVRVAQVRVVEIEPSGQRRILRHHAQVPDGESNFSGE